MSIITALGKSRPMIHLPMEQNQFEHICELIDPDKPVEVYRNLHKKCWSVRQRGKVRLHADYICLKSAEFKVSQKGRTRVLKEQRKNVHAFIKGFIVSPTEINNNVLVGGGVGVEWVDVTYNPYKHDSFVTDKGKAVLHADYVDMCIHCKNPVIVIEANRPRYRQGRETTTPDIRRKQ